MKVDHDQNDRIIDDLHFGLTKDTVQRRHLHALKFYTDFTDFATEITRSFRKSHPFESIKSINARNSKFYHVSKALRELIAYFGSNKKSHWFTGMNRKLYLTEFAISFQGPTSSTKTQEVAVNFAGEHGVILKFNNHNMPSAKRDRYFDANTFSCYIEEDEYLWMGNTFRLRVDNFVRSTSVGKTKSFKLRSLKTCVVIFENLKK